MPTIDIKVSDEIASKFFDILEEEIWTSGAGERRCNLEFDLEDSWAQVSVLSRDEQVYLKDQLRAALD